MIAWSTTSWRLLLVLLLLLPSEPAGASDCTKATTQREIEDCTRAEYDAANRDLNSAYRKYLASLPAPNREFLMKAQAAWVLYRDANCEASAAVYAGGTMATAELDGCKLLLTRERQAELKRIYEEPPYPPDR